MEWIGRSLCCGHPLRRFGPPFTCWHCTWTHCIKLLWSLPISSHAHTCERSLALWVADQSPAWLQSVRLYWIILVGSSVRPWTERELGKPTQKIGFSTCIFSKRCVSLPTKSSTFSHEKFQISAFAKATSPRRSLTLSHWGLVIILTWSCSTFHELETVVERTP